MPALSPARGMCSRPGESIRAADPQIPTVSAQPGSDSLLDGPLGRTTPIDDRMGTKPSGNALTSMRSMRRAWGIHSSHGSRDIHAFGPAQFICLSDGLPRHKMRIDDRMGSKPDTCPLACTCEVKEDGEIRRRNGSRDTDASSPTRFGSLLGGAKCRPMIEWARK